MNCELFSQFLSLPWRIKLCKILHACRLYILEPYLGMLFRNIGNQVSFCQDRIMDRKLLWELINYEEFRMISDIFQNREVMKDRNQHWQIQENPRFLKFPCINLKTNDQTNDQTNNLGFKDMVRNQSKQPFLCFIETIVMSEFSDFFTK